ncbi:MAG: DNA-processing protein DprA [Actinomycetota bacterium]|nr:DNA-processing protein DprA [Actinomycetota bacterium]
MSASDRAGYLFLSLMQARAGKSLTSRLGDRPAADVLEMPIAELVGETKASDKVVRVFEELKSVFDPDALQGRLATQGIRVVTLADEAYPSRLREVPDPPPTLFVKGEVSEAVSVALVGSRKATAAGLDTARALGRALGERGVCVVSGLALGVDAAAHQGALEVGGNTLGVLGCGIDIVYPKEHRDLFESVAQSGAIVSEYCLGEAPLAWRFPARNRIIAGLCDVVVVVEAPEKSGALITARHALEAGRDVWAVPGPPGALEYRGSNRLLADGAGVLWDISEFASAVGPRGASAKAERAPLQAPVPVGLPATAGAVLSGVGFEATGVDAVARRTGIGMRDVLPALALLELKGFVSRDAVGAYTRRATP